MLFNASTLKTGFANLVGFRPSVNPSIDVSGLETSTSGLFFQDAHPLVTLENIYAHRPRFDMFNYPDGSGDITASEGDVVKIGSLYYELDRDYSSETPSVGDLTQVNLFERWLGSIVEGAVTETISEWSSQSRIFKQSKTILADINEKMTDHEKPIDADINGRYAVMQIFPSNYIGELVTLNRVRVCVSATQVLPINILENGVNTVVTQSVEGGIPTWVDINREITETTLIYIDTNAIAGTLQNPYPNEIIPRRSHLLKFFTDDLDDIKTSGESFSFGLDAHYTRSCDLTDFLIRNKGVFAQAVYYRGAIKLLKYMAMNPSAEVTRENLNIDYRAIIYEIDGDARGYREVGLGKAYRDAMESIVLDTSGISKKCLNCGKKNTIRYGAVFG
jgi:hypothetical protein